MSDQHTGFYQMSVHFLDMTRINLGSDGEEEDVRPSVSLSNPRNLSGNPNMEPLGARPRNRSRTRTMTLDSGYDSQEDFLPLDWEFPDSTTVEEGVEPLTLSPESPSVSPMPGRILSRRVSTERRLQRQRRRRRLTGYHRVQDPLISSFDHHNNNNVADSELSLTPGGYYSGDEDEELARISFSPVPFDLTTEADSSGSREQGQGQGQDEVFAMEEDHGVEEDVSSSLSMEAAGRSPIMFGELRRQFSNNLTVGSAIVSSSSPMPCLTDLSLASLTQLCENHATSDNHSTSSNGTNVQDGNISSSESADASSSDEEDKENNEPSEGNEAKAKMDTFKLQEKIAKRKQSQEDRKQIKKKLKSCGLVSHLADLKKEE